jgi:hypothetical protein
VIEQNDERLVERKWVSGHSIKLVLSDVLRTENSRSNDETSR